MVLYSALPRGGLSKNQNSTKSSPIDHVEISEIVNLSPFLDSNSNKNGIESNQPLVFG